MQTPAVNDLEQGPVADAATLADSPEECLGFVLGPLFRSDRPMARACLCSSVAGHARKQQIPQFVAFGQSHLLQLNTLSFRHLTQVPAQVLHSRRLPKCFIRAGNVSMLIALQQTDEALPTRKVRCA